MLVDIWDDPIRWDAYVERSPIKSNYHRWRWRSAIENTYGHRPLYLAALDGNTICGILPLFCIDSRLFGRHLISLPFLSYGGILADSPEIERALADRALSFSRVHKLPHVELRQSWQAQLNWQETDSKVTMEVPLPEDPNRYWDSLSSGIRNKVRNGLKHGLRPDWGGREAIEQFYPIFANNMRNLGTPVYPKTWFENLYDCSPESVRVLTLWDGGRPVAAAFLIAYNDVLELPWSATLPESRKKYSAVVMYWTFLSWAIEHGFKRMDLGRCSRGSGVYDFKKHWRCEERPLYRYHWVPSGQPLPQLNVENTRFNLAVNVWKRLPLPIANRLGPLIVRSLG